MNNTKTTHTLNQSNQIKSKLPNQDYQIKSQIYHYDLRPRRCELCAQKGLGEASGDFFQNAP
jgi:hypothetical protein